MTFPDARDLNFDLSQSLPRIGRSKIIETVTESEALTVCPNQRLYFTKRSRIALGIEALHLQHIHFGKNHAKLHGYSNRLLQSLAGNAFESWSAAATYLVSVCILARAEAKRRSKAPSPLKGNRSPQQDPVQEMDTVLCF